jgi:hypothetical protein
MDGQMASFSGLAFDSGAFDVGAIVIHGKDGDVSGRKSWLFRKVEDGSSGPIVPPSVKWTPEADVAVRRRSVRDVGDFQVLPEFVVPVVPTWVPDALADVGRRRRPEVEEVAVAAPAARWVPQLLEASGRRSAAAGDYASLPAVARPAVWTPDDVELARIARRPVRDDLLVVGSSPSVWLPFEPQLRRARVSRVPDGGESSPAVRVLAWCPVDEVLPRTRVALLHDQPEVVLSSQAVAAWQQDELPLLHARQVRVSELVPVLSGQELAAWQQDELPLLRARQGRAPELVSVFSGQELATWQQDELPLLRARQGRAPELVSVLFGQELAAWQQDELPILRARLARAPELVPVLPGQAAASAWLPDEVAAGRSYRIRQVGSVEAPVLSNSELAWVSDVGASRRSARSQGLLDPHVKIVVLPTAWGFEASLPTYARTYRTLSYVSEVLVPPVGPSPIPNLPINVYIGGGEPRVEVIAGPSYEEVDDYLDDVAELAARRRAVDPDDVLGKSEYEAEKFCRKSDRQVAPPSFPAVCRFEPGMRSETTRRVTMLVGDARSRGIGVSESESFVLRRRLGIFGIDRELKMVGGSMVKVTCPPGDRIALAKLARVHLFRLVAWSPGAVFMFDDTTLTPKVPPIAWLAIGAGFGVTVGIEVGRRRALESLDLRDFDRPVQKSVGKKTTVKKRKR